MAEAHGKRLCLAAEKNEKVEGYCLVKKQEFSFPQQLGNYLVEQQYILTGTTLILYCLQICKALAYLEGLNMVHR